MKVRSEETAAIEIYMLMGVLNLVHSVASFLPWHRYFVQIYEQALKECGYTGAAR
jgi:hypothetical protein